MKIVIAEDNIRIREELQSFLEKYGYIAVGLNTFDNVVQDILAQQGDLLLLDVNLPGVDGYSICREIRKTSDLPVIVVTSRNSEMDELMSMNLGADDFVTKPYNTQILLARINSVLKRVNKGSIFRAVCWNMREKKSNSQKMNCASCIRLPKDEAPLYRARS